ncbi:MAG: hypothetical protein Q7S29_06510 [Candidatus Peribacter sp.]|nr:hypothetical protein [Candidatus Peribacter sp.]
MNVPMCEGKKGIACTSALSEENTLDCVLQDGLCVSRFVKYCKEWQQAQSQCTAGNAFIQDETRALPDLRSCTNLTQIRMGHGMGCENFVKIINGCTRQCKDATCMAFDDIGCSVFADTTAVERWIMTKRLFYMGLGQTITVSANQTTASWPTCQNRINYTITASEVKKEYATCPTRDSYCIPKSHSILCKDTTTKKVSQVYCCECTNGTSIWSDSDGSCPPSSVTNNTCSFTVLSLRSTEAALMKARTLHDTCLTQAERTCAKNGLFWKESDPAESSLEVEEPTAGGELTRQFARVASKYSCTIQCGKFLDTP